MLNVEIQFSPSFAMATVKLNQGEAVQAEAGAMTGMAGGVEITTKAQGGLLGGLKRSVLGGETFFINTFSANAGPGEVIVAPALPGDIIHMPVDGSKAVMVQSGAWLAGESSVAVDTKWGGAKTFFSGEGLFLLRCSGQGDMLVASYGAIFEKELAAGEIYRVDTGHIVAFDEGVGMQVNKVGGWKSTLLSGEGLVATFTGPGKLWQQSRSPQDLIGWLTAKLPFTQHGN
jgi:uncharacterized protein (TIGR00266 family)